MTKITIYLCFLLWSITTFAQDEKFHIYLCLGQSNMEGHTYVKPEVQDTCDISERFLTLAAVDFPEQGRRKKEWYRAVPPLVRSNTGLSPVDYFGRTMLKSLPADHRVGVVCVAMGGCKIELFDKEHFQEYVATAPDWLKENIKVYDSNPYNHLVEMARFAQKQGVIKGILLHQGESNTGDSEWPSKVKSIYENLLNDLNLKATDVPLIAGEVAHTDQGGLCATMNSFIQQLPLFIPTSHVISSSGCPIWEDHVHFSASGYRMMGQRYAEKMLELLEKKSPH